MFRQPVGKLDPFGPCLRPDVVQRFDDVRIVETNRGDVDFVVLVQKAERKGCSARCAEAALG